MTILKNTDFQKLITHLKRNSDANTPASIFFPISHEPHVLYGLKEQFNFCQQLSHEKSKRISDLIILWMKHYAENIEHTKIMLIIDTLQSTSIEHVVVLFGSNLNQLQEEKANLADFVKNLQHPVHIFTFEPSRIIQK